MSAERVNVIDLEVLPLLNWPQDASVIASLSLEDKIYWYSSQDARNMIFLAQKKEFLRFWYFHYLLPLRIKRYLYKLKNVFKFKVWS